MHRHGYKGRKFGRERDQRKALLKGLTESLVRDEKIETTLPKAKELVPHVEKIITKAKKGQTSLHHRRQVVESLYTVESAHKLVDSIAPKLTGRDSGHLRITRTRIRRGDNAQLATVSFVDDLHEAPVAKAAKPAADKKEAPVKKAAKKNSTSAKATTDKEEK